MKLWQRIAEFLRLSQIKKQWKRLGGLLAIVVVFMTTYMLILPAVSMQKETLCGVTEHTHSDECYIGDILSCGMVEHVHEERCFIAEFATNGNVTDGNVRETEQERWENELALFAQQMPSEEKERLDELSEEDRHAVVEVIYAIEKLPTYDEFFEKLDRFYDSDDMEGEESYILKIQNLTSCVYCAYQPLEELQQYIYNSDRMFDMMDVFRNMPQTYVTGSTAALKFNYINHTWNISSWDTSVITPIIVHGGSVSEKIGSAVNRYWYGVVVEYNSADDYYYVSEIYQAETSTSNSDILNLEASTSKGFVICIWSADDNSATTAQKTARDAVEQVVVGDVVEISMDPTTVSSQYKEAGFGTITFKEYVPPQPEVEVEEELDLYKNEADASDSQIDDGGGKITSADGRVITTKTINGTSEENVFDITLTVQTQTDVQTFLSEPDMAVVIVMDISNTMNSYYPKNQTKTTRYDAAVTAAENFINQFAGETSGLSQLGFVAFNTSAHEIISLQPCTTANAAALIQEMKTETDAIISALGYADDHTRFTNVEGGLKRGYDMLKNSGNANQYIVFLSDGFPTTYLKDNSDSSTNYEGYDPYTSSGTKGADGVFYDYVQGKYCSYGTSYSDKASIKAREMATTIKDSGAKVFSIGVDIGGQTIQYYSDATSGSGYYHSICDRTSTTYEIGDASSSTAYQNWLRNNIGSGYYYDSTNSAELEAAFSDIFAEIRELNEQSTKTVWTATDPLPVHDEESQVVGFIHFFDKDGNVVGSPNDPESVTGSHTAGGENTAYHKDNIVSWDIKKSGYTTTVDGSVTTYYYSLKYRVRLVNEAPPFVENTVYETNGDAFLEYRNIVTTDGVQQISDKKEVSFSKPAVHGFVSQFSFTKENNIGQILPGAEFTLTHDDSVCTKCHGDNTALTDHEAHADNYVSEHGVHNIGPYVAVSDENGLVSFDNIPSGHQYIMTETVTPEGYLNSGSQYFVNVAYDVLNVTEVNDGKAKTWLGINDKVVNVAIGSVLPATGGTGNYPLYIVGMTLITLSSVFLICKYKKDRERRRKGSKV